MMPFELWLIETCEPLQQKHQEAIRERGVRVCWTIAGFNNTKYANYIKYNNNAYYPYTWRPQVRSKEMYRIGLCQNKLFRNKSTEHPHQHPTCLSRCTLRPMVDPFEIHCDTAGLNLDS